jgi:hypothetical protein
MLYKSDAKPRSGVRDLKQNKHQLLHRIASVWATLIHNTNVNKEMVENIHYITKVLPLIVFSLQK